MSVDSLSIGSLIVSVVLNVVLAFLSYRSVSEAGRAYRASVRPWIGTDKGEKARTRGAVIVQREQDLIHVPIKNIGRGLALITPVTCWLTHEGTRWPGKPSRPAVPRAGVTQLVFRVPERVIVTIEAAAKFDVEVQCTDLDGRQSVRVCILIQLRENIWIPVRMDYFAGRSRRAFVSVEMDPEEHPLALPAEER